MNGKRINGGNGEKEAIEEKIARTIKYPSSLNPSTVGVDGDRVQSTIKSINWYS